MIITIDGPSGTGKSTVAKGLSAALNVTYFDTGALYRAMSWKILDSNIAYENQEDLQKLLTHFSFEIKVSQGEKRYFVGSQDVTKAIRTPEVTAIVSEVSALKEVRDALKPIQVNFAKKMDVVFEGRDLGTIVFPNADIKFYLTARAEVRAKRRFLELQQKFPRESFSLEKTLEDIKERDAYDSSREIAPLKKADDAILIDTSDLTVEETIEKMKQLTEEKKR